ncbi:inosine/xanthosine triphosphatase [Tepidibacillus fermentans]|uniref:Probable inosine/xanthosine triphosphatase n=1 Tax=Tepidibacillus fermentans TaxID=1281767 RepID=A0A4R3KLZ6_9BACI|nr:inosine/xanthosine triphosphatase [Tepidibacillus fermentans]TCS84466.1 inosine/xanthosine triphosphatase [Tepidibacillus fermentans]
MLRIGVGSKNPAKVQAVRSAFEKIGYEVEIIGLNVPSGVSDQPFSDEETIRGAINRATAVMAYAKEHTNVGALDYAVGLEGGVVETPFGFFLCNWGAVVNADGEIGIGGGQRVQLPQIIVDGLQKGKELGDIIDPIAGKDDVRKKEGTIGILTNSQITRSQMFTDVVVCSFARFLHPELY